MVQIEVANVVGTITYTQELDLKALEDTFSERREISDTTYEPGRNHWLQTRFQPDDTYVAFYRKGKCSIAGCRSVEHFHETVEKVNRIMQELLETGSEPSPRACVSNIVATADLDTKIPLELLAVEFGLDVVEYEPEQFPALVYRASDHVMLVFSSGKILCTGLTTLEKVSNAVQDMASRIESATKKPL